MCSKVHFRIRASSAEWSRFFCAVLLLLVMVPGEGTQALAGLGGKGGADIVVAKDGSGDYTTISEALAAAWSGNRDRFTVILIRADVYEEQPVMPTSLHHVALVGEMAGSGVKVTSSGAAGDSSLDECATFQLLASDVVVSNIIFENAHGPGEQGGDEDQALAIKVAGTRIAFYGCTFLGYQDTLYAASGLQYYKGCNIHGRMDFVFGNAKAVFEDCNFRLIYWGGAYFAQARGKEQNTGFVIKGGSLRPYGKGPIKPGYLARSWGDYSTVVLVNTYFAEGSVRAEGWSYVSGYKHMDKVTFGAYGCSGPGYNASAWEIGTEMSAEEVKPFLSNDYINKMNWIADPAAVTRGVATPASGGKKGNRNNKEVADSVSPAQASSGTRKQPAKKPGANSAGNANSGKPSTSGSAGPSSSNSGKGKGGKTGLGESPAPSGSSSTGSPGKKKQPSDISGPVPTTPGSKKRKKREQLAEVTQPPAAPAAGKKGQKVPPVKTTPPPAAPAAGKKGQKVPPVETTPPPAAPAAGKKGKKVPPVETTPPPAAPAAGKKGKKVPPVETTPPPAAPAAGKKGKKVPPVETTPPPAAPAAGKKGKKVPPVETTPPPAAPAAGKKGKKVPPVETTPPPAAPSAGNKGEKVSDGNPASPPAPPPGKKGKHKDPPAEVVSPPAPPAPTKKKVSGGSSTGSGGIDASGNTGSTGKTKKTTPPPPVPADNTSSGSDSSSGGESGSSAGGTTDQPTKKRKGLFGRRKKDKSGDSSNGDSSGNGDNSNGAGNDPSAADGASGGNGTAPEKKGRVKKLVKKLFG
ncbi:unnamed protein product [Closterium sp. Yama58-4]|nr:unnamed protein product [Closterium sp. Yama58-4]